MIVAVAVYDELRDVALVVVIDVMYCIPHSETVAHDLLVSITIIFDCVALHSRRPSLVKSSEGVYPK